MTCRRRQQQLPPVQRFGNFHQIALVPERYLFQNVAATVEDEVDQAANDTHSRREQQMQRFLAEPELLANAEQFPPMRLEKIPRRRHDLMPTLRPGPHRMIL